MHFYPFNIGDYATATAHLEPLEDIAYRRLMDLYYSTEKPIPECLNKTARLIRMRTHSDCIAIVLEEFFTLEDDGYHCDRIDVELFKFHEKSAKASKSAKVRWKKSKQKQKVKSPSERNANALKTHSEGNAKQEPINNKQETINNNKHLSAKANDSLEIFTYWKGVMKKTEQSKLNAKRERAIKARLKEGYTVDQIKDAILGCSMTPHNMGQNNNGKKYDDLELICRDGSNVERFISNMQTVPNNSQPQSLGDAGGDWHLPENRKIL